jgi:hypothetical protein
MSQQSPESEGKDNSLDDQVDLNENVAVAIQQLIQNMQRQMEEMCNNVLQQMDEMSLRVEKLETMVQSLMRRAGVNKSELISPASSLLSAPQSDIATPTQTQTETQAQSQSHSEPQTQHNYYEQIQKRLIEHRHQQAIPRPIGKK